MTTAEDLKSRLRDETGAWLSTADLYDRFEERLQSCETQFRDFGARAAFGGPIRTIRCFRDNAMIKAVLNSPGDGAVLVVDGGASLSSALLGDLIAGAGVDNGWAGVVINGAVRDSAVLAGLDLGVKALGTNPRKSAKQSDGQLDVELAFGQARFVPGHWLVADADGVVTLAD